MSRCVSAGCRWLIASAVAFGLVQATCAADNKSKSQGLPEGWVVRTFRVPEGFFWWMPPGIDDHFTSNPPLPPANAPESVQVTHAKSCTDRARKLMEAWGAPLAEGSVVLCDPQSGTVAVRATTEQMQSIGSFLWQALHSVPQILTLQVDIVQTNAPTMCQLTKECERSGDHGSAWYKMLDLVKKGAAKSVGALRVETHSGQRVVSEAGPEVIQMKGATVDERGRVEAVHEERLTGLRFEAEPAIGGERNFIDVNFALEFHYAPPTQHIESAGPVGPQGKIECPVFDCHVAKVSTATCLTSGGTRLIGVWTPEGTPEFADGGIMQAAFLHADIARLVPPENKALAPLLAVIADKVSPIPRPTPQAAKAQAEGKPLVKMQMRSFEVPPNFLAASGEGSGDSSAPVVFPSLPSDPFASTEQYPQKSVRISSAEKILRSNGIDFPEGSRAEFNPAANTLIVTSIPKVLDQVDALVHDGCFLWPLNIVATLHIVEADGATLRRLSRECAAEADHTDAWKQMEGFIADRSAKCLRAVQLGTRSGQSATCEAGEERVSLGDVRFSEAKKVTKAPVALTPDTGADQKPQQAVSSRGASSDSKGIRLINLKSESRIAGTRLDFEPVIAPDGRVLGVNVTLEHHYAPPTLRPSLPAPKGKTSRVELPATDFHFAKITTAITATTGMTKLLGMWKPEGTPEFEGKDVMQAAFLRVDVVPVEAPAAEEAKKMK